MQVFGEPAIPKLLTKVFTGKVCLLIFDIHARPTLIHRFVGRRASASLCKS